MIAVDGVSVARGRRQVVHDVSLRARAGALTALIGPNGSGKSSLVAAISGDVPVTAGTITIGGVDVATLSPVAAARQRAVMTQQANVAFGFSVGEVVAMGRAPWRGSPQAADDAAAVADALATADLAALRDRPVQALSGGEQARTALARVLAQRTPVVILDEPTAALDLRHQVDTLRCLRERADAGAAVLVVLHDLSLAAAYADHVVLLSQGQAVAQGTVHDVLTPAVLQPVYGLSLTVVAHPDSGLPILVPAAP